MRLVARPDIDGQAGGFAAAVDDDEHDSPGHRRANHSPPSIGKARPSDWSAIAKDETAADASCASALAIETGKSTGPCPSLVPDRPLFCGSSHVALPGTQRKPVPPVSRNCHRRSRRPAGSSEIAMPFRRRLDAQSATRRQCRRRPGPAAAHRAFGGQCGAGDAGHAVQSFDRSTAQQRPDKAQEIPASHSCEGDKVQNRLVDRSVRREAPRTGEIAPLGQIESLAVERASIGLESDPPARPVDQQREERDRIGKPAKQALQPWGEFCHCCAVGANAGTDEEQPVADRHRIMRLRRIIRRTGGERRAGGRMDKVALLRAG